ncbi:MAG: hypothetical protein MZU97_26825 [Bacillus subtilis]|nr:hypothetical protein [Bacillus subtilis]
MNKVYLISILIFAFLSINLTYLQSVTASDKLPRSPGSNANVINNSSGKPLPIHSKSRTLSNETNFPIEDSSYYGSAGVVRNSRCACDGAIIFTIKFLITGIMKELAI